MTEMTKIDDMKYEEGQKEMRDIVEERWKAGCTGEDQQEPKEMLDHPEHYTSGNMSGIECWDHYELAFNEDEFRGAMKNNLYKYIFRCRKKGDQEKFIEDLGKCIRYLNRWISFEEGERIGFYKSTPLTEASLEADQEEFWGDSVAANEVISDAHREWNKRMRDLVDEESKPAIRRPHLHNFDENKHWVWYMEGPSTHDPLDLKYGWYYE